MKFIKFEACTSLVFNRESTMQESCEYDGDSLNEVDHAIVCTYIMVTKTGIVRRTNLDQLAFQ